jgi:hypothetical protein
MISPVTFFMDSSFLKRSWGDLQPLMQYVCYLEEGKPSMKPLDKFFENAYSIKETKAGIALYSLRIALKSHFEPIRFPQNALHIEN